MFYFLRLKKNLILSYLMSTFNTDKAIDFRVSQFNKHSSFIIKNV